jgi:hypothetical protein
LLLRFLFALALAVRARNSLSFRNFTCVYSKSESARVKRLVKKLNIKLESKVEKSKVADDATLTSGGETTSTTAAEAAATAAAALVAAAEAAKATIMTPAVAAALQKSTRAQYEVTDAQIDAVVDARDVAIDALAKDAELSKMLKGGRFNQELLSFLVALQERLLAVRNDVLDAERLRGRIRNQIKTWGALMQAFLCVTFAFCFVALPRTQISPIDA